MAEPILVTFNSTVGNAHMPRTHTCGCTLSLSSNYFSYQDFEDEFSLVLNNELIWEMDTV